MTDRNNSVFANDRLRLSVTDTCNLTCSYCTNEGQVHGHKDFLSLDWWAQFSDRIMAENVYIRKLNITGGEPLLHRHLDKIVERAVAIADSVSLNTNGTLLTPERVRALYGLGLHNIKFGIDWVFGGPTKPLIHTRTIDSPRLFASIMEATALMPRSSLNVVVSQFNVAHLHETVAYLVDHGIDKVEFLELIEHDFRRQGTALSRTTTAAQILASLRDKFVRVEYNPRLAKYICWTSRGLMVQVAEDFCLRRVCQNLWTRIDARGRFVPCIKGRDFYEIDFGKPLALQISTMNLLMCNGPQDFVPRASDGRLLPREEEGAYAPVDLTVLLGQGVNITQLDP